jgi:DNA-binding beta-propeller fold protein YncE
MRTVKVRNPAALALDPSDNVYVANLVNHSSVLVYSAGAKTLLQTITKGVDQATALLVGSP